MTAPAWLVQIQREFTELLATPLDRSTGRLLSREEDYPGGLLERVVHAPPIAPAERLAVYHRQYWYRLLDLLQTSFPVSTRLLGHYHFNEPAALYFSAHPPRFVDLAEEADDFPAFFGEWARLRRPEDADYLGAAMALDRAFRAVFAAPRSEPFTPGVDLGPRLLRLRLVANPARALYRQRWPLLQERPRMMSDPGETPWRRLEPLEREESYLLVRREGATSFVRIGGAEARLYELLTGAPVGEALGTWMAEFAKGAPHESSEVARRWLERSVRLGLWSGVFDE